MNKTAASEKRNLVMEKVGLFAIQTSVFVPQRGVVAVGRIEEGRVPIGAVATLEIAGQRVPVTIRGVESGGLDSGGHLLFGLLLSFPDNDLDRLAAERPLEKQGIEIFTT